MLHDSDNVALASAARLLRPPSQLAVWFLVGRAAAGESVRHIPVHSSPFTIGRRTDAALSLPSRAVSSKHARLEDDGETLLLTDLGSTNGTFVNGTRVWESVQLRPEDLVQFADVPFRVLKQSSSTSGATASQDLVDYAMALVQLDRLMSEKVVTPHYQSIVRLPDGEPLAYEVLARSRLAGLEMPKAMFAAAGHLSLESQLSQMIRSLAVHQTRHMVGSPHLFLNTHPKEITDDQFLASVRQLRELNSQQAFTLEIHEELIAEVASMQTLREELKGLNIGFAFDDFGVGNSRLRELSQVQPDYVKFDMSLIRDIASATVEHRNMVRSLVGVVRDIGAAPLAEGIETAAELEVCLELGFTLAQGFFFDRPVAWR